MLNRYRLSRLSQHAVIMGTALLFLSLIVADSFAQNIQPENQKLSGNPNIVVQYRISTDETILSLGFSYAREQRDQLELQFPVAFSARASFKGRKAPRGQDVLPSFVVGSARGLFQEKPNLLRVGIDGTIVDLSHMECKIRRDNHLGIEDLTVILSAGQLLAMGRATKVRLLLDKNQWPLFDSQRADILALAQKLNR